MNLNIRHDPCDCPPDFCAKFVEPPSACINRLTGDVRVTRCERCAPGQTWHQDGRCLKCGGRAQ